MPRYTYRQLLSDTYADFFSVIEEKKEFILYGLLALLRVAIFIVNVFCVLDAIVNHSLASLLIPLITVFIIIPVLFILEKKVTNGL